MHYNVYASDAIGAQGELVSDGEAGGVYTAMCDHMLFLDLITGILPGWVTYWPGRRLTKNPTFVLVRSADHAQSQLFMYDIRGSDF